jgi:hypothetical protein
MLHLTKPTSKWRNSVRQSGGVFRHPRVTYESLTTLNQIIDDGYPPLELILIRSKRRASFQVSTTY